MHVAIATPLHDGRICGPTAGAIAHAMRLLDKRGDRATWLQLAGESLVTRARNMLVGEFLESDADTIVFVDGDITFDPRSLLTLVDVPHHVVGGLYRLKREGGGFVCEEPRDASGDLGEVDRIGTGFLAISRAAITSLIAAHPETAYRNDAPSRAGKIDHALFDTALRDGRYLSEDYVFCDRWRALGGQVLAHLGIHLGHIGSKIYE